MTVSIAMVALVSRGVYSPAAEDNADYLLLKGWAQAQLDKEAPEGLDTSTYDRCHALLIVNMYVSGDPKSGMSSFTSGDFSGSQTAGVTSWLLEYRSALTLAASTSSEATDAEMDGKRCDFTMPDLKLDQNDVPSYFQGVE